MGLQSLPRLPCMAEPPPTAWARPQQYRYRLIRYWRWLTLTVVTCTIISVATGHFAIDRATSGWAEISARIDFAVAYQKVAMCLHNPTGTP